jgi:hypothetical protein
MEKRTTNERVRESRLPGAETPPAPFRATEPTELERLKERLLQQLLAETGHDPEINPVYRRAANDALSLAWVTPYPLLFLPVLLEEKAAEARRRSYRQRAVLNQTSKWKAVA